MIAGILDLIPNLGATIAGIIIGLVALSVSLEALIVFAIVIVVYQQIENYILQPTIIGKAAGVAGFTVLASVLAFGALFGMVGAIIGVPIAAGLQIVAEELTAGRRARIAAADAASSSLRSGSMPSAVYTTSGPIVLAPHLWRDHRTRADRRAGARGARRRRDGRNARRNRRRRRALPSSTASSSGRSSGRDGG